MAGCVILAVLPNAQNMYAQWDLGQNSIRGATELTTTTPSGEKISSGLDKDYAFAWSYGKGELLTFWFRMPMVEVRVNARPGF